MPNQSQLFLIALLLLYFLLPLLSCRQTDQEELENLLRLNDLDANEANIARLTADIAATENDIQQIIALQQKKKSLYQRLGLAYLELAMFGPAKESFAQAFAISSGSADLAYYLAVSQANIANTWAGEPRMSGLNDSRDYYLQALALNSEHRQALYGLAVLDLFMLDQSAEGRNMANRLLELDGDNVDAMFLAARGALLTGDQSEAIRLYKMAQHNSEDEEQKRRATENLNTLLGDEP